MSISADSKLIYQVIYSASTDSYYSSINISTCTYTLQYVYSYISDLSLSLSLSLLGLDDAAFQSHLPANKLTQQETNFFPDIAGGSQSAIMEFLFIRNKILQAWLQDPMHELTAEKAQAAVHLPHPGMRTQYMYHLGFDVRV